MPVYMTINASFFPEKRSQFRKKYYVFSWLSLDKAEIRFGVLLYYKTTMKPILNMSHIGLSTFSLGCVIIVNSNALGEKEVDYSHLRKNRN
jgi:hypothetical protein